MFLDLQFSFFDDLTSKLFKVAVLSVLTKGHCKQLGAPHFWLSKSSSFEDRPLFLITAFPIEGFFLTAIMIFVSPMIVLRSASESFRIVLNEFILSKKKSGKVSTSFSS